MRIRGVLAVRAEEAHAILAHSLEELGRHEPNFTIRETSVLTPIEEALAPLATPAATQPMERPRAAA